MDIQEKIARGKKNVSIVVKKKNTRETTNITNSYISRIWSIKNKTLNHILKHITKLPNKHSAFNISRNSSESDVNAITSDFINISKERQIEFRNLINNYLETQQYDDLDNPDRI